MSEESTSRDQSPRENDGQAIVESPCAVNAECIRGLHALAVACLFRETVVTPKPAKKKPQTKFTSTIYCGNCGNVGDYEFKRGTILHAKSDYVWSEYRNTTPDGERINEIRVNNRYHGKSVECKFCKCTTSLHIRERDTKESR